MIMRLLLVVAMAAMLGSQPAKADRNNLVIDLVDEPSSLDPHVQWNPDSYYVYRNIFDNLLTRDDRGEIAPQIATAWRAISDTEIEFDIRQGVKFHDGTPLTVDDVVFSLRRILNPEFRSPQLSQFNRITAVEAVGTDKIRIRTNGPYPVLLAQLVKLSIVSRAYVERVGNEEFNRTPMGSGPYRFVSWARGVSVVLEANADYWGGRPSFPRIEFHAVNAVATRVADLTSGRADLVVSLGSDEARQLQNDARAEARITLSERASMFRLTTLTGPTQDIRLRQAIRFAINRQLIADALLGGFDHVVNAVGTPVSFGYIDGIDPPRYDPEAARRLIREIGAPAQQELTLLTSPVFDQRVVQAIHQMLLDVGLHVNIVSIDLGTFLRRSTGDPAQQGDFSFFRWSCACQDLDGTLAPLFDSHSTWSTWHNPDMDRELAAAAGTLDSNARLQHYRRVHEMIAENALAVPLFQTGIIYGANRHLVWTPTPNESLFLARMSWRD
jgi:peptide/nickel transport system substrate-binding protein